MLWRDNNFVCNMVAKDMNYIHLEVLCKLNQGKFALTLVYAPNELTERCLLWEKLVHLKQLVQGPWLIMGDFNNVLSVEERMGGLQPSPVEILPFQECISECGVEDMRSYGRVFT